MKHTTIILVVMALMTMASCRTPKTIIDTHYVHDTTYVSRVDSIFKRDSIVKEKETIVMQLDSAAMAAYGIHLKNAESAWLVKTRELEMILKEMREIKNDSTYHSKVDSVYINVPQNIYIEKPLTWWKKMLMVLGVFFLCFFLVTLACDVIKKVLNLKTMG